MNNKTRNEIFARDNYTCIYCGASGDNIPLEVDHIIPVSKGGTNDINNLVTACMTCNRSKHATILSVDELRTLAGKIDSSLDYLLSLIHDKELGEKRVNRITLNLSDSMFADIQDLSNLYGKATGLYIMDLINKEINTQRKKINAFRELRNNDR